MIWSDTDIRAGLDSGHIRIEPMLDEAIQPASVDVRLADKLACFNELRTALAIDPSRPVEDEMVKFPFSGYRIYPGQFLLGSIIEKITLPDNVVARIEGKSSLGRLGLTIHSTAGFIDPGFTGHVTLEIGNHGPYPILLRAGMWIAQIAFQSTLSPCTVPYGAKRGSHYCDQDKPEPVISRSFQQRQVSHEAL